MNSSPFNAAQRAELERRADDIADKVREALYPRLTFTPEERQALALFRELDASGRQCLLMQLKAQVARQAGTPRPALRIVKGGAANDRATDN